VSLGEWPFGWVNILGIVIEDCGDEDVGVGGLEEDFDRI
jgi:hypothetical protein